MTPEDKQWDDMTPQLRAAQDRIEWLERDLAAMRKALRLAYPYVMDALRDAEENTPATAYVVLDDLVNHIVPALAEAGP